MEGDRHEDICPEPSQYAELGPHHWIGITPVPWWRSDPFTHARYDLPLSIISNTVRLPGALGLDVGCGDGVMLHKIAARGGSCIGLDTDPLALRYAVQRYRELHGTPPRLIQGSCYRIPLAGESVDFVVAIELLQHLERPVTFFQEANRVLRPGGVLCLRVSNRAGLPASRRPPAGFRIYYTADELRTLLLPLFNHVEIFGQSPQRLVRWWRRPTSLRPVNQLIRVGIRLAATLGLNPFLHFIGRNPGGDYATLVGSCRKGPSGS